MQKEHDRTLLDVIALLVLVQAGIAVVSTLEVAILGAALGGGALVLTAVNGAAALVALVLARGLRRESKVARRLTLWVEVAIVVVAVIDLALALVFAQRGLELVPILTRIVVPVTVVVLLRKPLVKEWFGVQAAPA